MPRSKSIRLALCGAAFLVLTLSGHAGGEVLPLPGAGSNPFASTPSTASLPSAPPTGQVASVAGPGQILPAPAPSAAIEDNPGLTCQKAIRGAEVMMGIPAHLLHAIALVESGKLINQADDTEEDGKKRLSAWPWTVMAEGRGRYLPTKQDAIREVRQLQKRGISNIDVGCMQINLGYHGDAFSSLEEAFEPMNNVAYAAALLSRLQRERHSWTMATGYYHSSNKSRLNGYRKKVIALWKQLERAAIQAQSAKAGMNKSPRSARSYRNQTQLEIIARNRAMQPR